MASTTYVDSVTLSSAAEWNKWDTAAYPALGSVAGTNTITAAGPANLTYVATNPVLWFIPAATNTGATTINITPSGGLALGAKNIFANGAACVGGEIVSGVPCAIVYDGTQFNIIGVAKATGTQASTFTFNGSGGTSSSTTMTYQKVGNFVWLHIPAVTATSGTGSTQFVADTALPTAIRPASVQQVQSITNILNNGGSVDSAGIITIATSGILTIQRDPSGTAWTNSSTCGTISGITVVYFVG